MNKIRDEQDVKRLSKVIDLALLQRYLGEVLNEGLRGRKESELPTEELNRVFDLADKKINARFGLSVWDAMMLVNQSVNTGNADSRGFDDWRRVYNWVFDVSRAHGIDVSLQENYLGVQELTVLCSSTQFERTASLLASGSPSLCGGFRVILRGTSAGSVVQERVYQIEPS